MLTALGRGARPFLSLPLPFCGLIMRTRLSTRQATARSTLAAAAPRPRRARARSPCSDDDGGVIIIQRAPRPSQANRPRSRSLSSNPPQRGRTINANVNAPSLALSHARGRRAPEANARSRSSSASTRPTRSSTTSMRSSCAREEEAMTSSPSPVRRTRPAGIPPAGYFDKLPRQYRATVSASSISPSRRSSRPSLDAAQNHRAPARARSQSLPSDTDSEVVFLGRWMIAPGAGPSRSARSPGPSAAVPNPAGVRSHSPTAPSVAPSSNVSDGSSVARSHSSPLIRGAARIVRGLRGRPANTNIPSDAGSMRSLGRGPPSESEYQPTSAEGEEEDEASGFTSLGKRKKRVGGRVRRVLGTVTAGIRAAAKGKKAAKTVAKPKAVLDVPGNEDTVRLSGSAPGEIPPFEAFTLNDVFNGAAPVEPDVVSVHEIEDQPTWKSEARAIRKAFTRSRLQAALPSWFGGNYVARQTLVPIKPAHLCPRPILPPQAVKSHKHAIRYAAYVQNGGMKAHARKRAEKAKERDVLHAVHALPLHVVTSTGWTTRVNVKELGAAGQRLIMVDWSGRSDFGITDTDKLLLVKGICWPGDPTWPSVIAGCGDWMETLSRTVAIPASSWQNRRGNLGAINFGISFGGGQQRPGNLALSHHNRLAIQEATSQPCFKRLTGHIDSVMRGTFYEHWALYHETLEGLLEADSTLVRNFPGSCMACATFNLGPSCVSLPHRDTQNLAFGLCIVHSQGDYNPDKGGHLVLWDLGYVIRFPPGSTIIFPSALIKHSNTPIQEGETRRSFTQFFSGHLFRWAYNGDRTDKEAHAGFDERDWLAYNLDKSTRKKFGKVMIKPLTGMKSHKVRGARPRVAALRPGLGNEAAGFLDLMSPANSRAKEVFEAASPKHRRADGVRQALADDVDRAPSHCSYIWTTVELVLSQSTERQIDRVLAPNIVSIAFGLQSGTSPSSFILHPSFSSSSSPLKAHAALPQDTHASF
ncbi:uncharacterized protein SCHCODRAFT_01095360 [Schizophyllum commune H4-8]|nr:uncharacterized protein SCHCODRAFT_01095360 [Schizophyllum commune H4-8]KAI5891908.1 hypothetical protein SCHCODRAFT_01095360 [Schizophyllum commune H4-8]